MNCKKIFRDKSSLSTISKKSIRFSIWIHSSEVNVRTQEIRLLGNTNIKQNLLEINVRSWRNSSRSFNFDGFTSSSVTSASQCSNLKPISLICEKSWNNPTQAIELSFPRLTWHFIGDRSKYWIYFVYFASHNFVCWNINLNDVSGIGFETRHVISRHIAAACTER